MSEEARDQETAKLLKRPNEVNEDSAERTTKRIKAEGEHNEDDKRYPKKKVVLLLAYSGKGYYGMQVFSFTTCNNVAKNLELHKKWMSPTTLKNL